MVNKIHISTESAVLLTYINVQWSIRNNWLIWSFHLIPIYLLLLYIIILYFTIVTKQEITVLFYMFFFVDVQLKGLWCLTPISTIFQLYRGGQFIGGRNQSTWRKPPICLGPVITDYSYRKYCTWRKITAWIWRVL